MNKDLYLYPLWEIIDLTASVIIITISRKGDRPEAVRRMI
jgi:hypothetical protein